MTEHFQEVKDEVYEASPDRKTRRLLAVLCILLALLIITTSALVWVAYFKERDKALTLAQQIDMACQSGELGEGFSPEDTDRLCKNAAKVIEQNDPELQEGEVQEREIQEPERQDPEFQDPEAPNAEKQDPESQDPEAQEEETQDPEIQDEETQDPENQDPEQDDPDPNDQIEGVECTFSGTGTFTITFHTDNGDVTSTCVGDGTPPGQLP